MTDIKSTRRIRVWDLPLRLFHWALLVCVCGAIATGEFSSEKDWHARFGYAVLSLLIFRIVWGFVGSTHARFLNFVRGPGGILAYLKKMKSESGVMIGHNPIGALSVIGMLLVLGLQAGSGLFITDQELFEGPFFKYISNSTASLLAQIHEANATLIFILIGLHLAAILFYRFVKRDNLVTPMITGNKEVPASAPEQSAAGGSALTGLVIFGIASALVWYLTTRL
ncbi:cytochrome b/b6 domain-containing protein [Uliginosibacterium paludis]|uniref:Cytochrome b/b6 domain-containing protein n=1 Tax=Uliginosibacterium paludis TaxID=1615952 RepID=A0ABV2CTB8_9RHOO